MPNSRPTEVTFTSFKILENSHNCQNVNDTQILRLQESWQSYEILESQADNLKEQNTKKKGQITQPNIDLWYTSISRIFPIILTVVSLCLLSKLGFVDVVFAFAHFCKLVE